MGTRIYHDDGFWKEAIPNIAKIKKEFFTNTEMAGMVYAKFKNTSFSPSMFWVKKEFETLPSSISPADLEMCRQIHEQFRVTAVTQTKTQPTNNDQTLVDGNGHWTEIEEKILKDIRQVLSAHSLDRVLNWLADLDNSDQSISILQQVQDMLSAKLQEAIEKRKLEQAKEAEKNHLAAVQADLEQKLAEVKAKLK